MDKKYQVFISSTYTDMRAERQAAVEAILDAGHIPAGMELFAASDKAQMEVIKGWIDESDIFMLVLGGRYGSIEPESGKSYIQLEYEYAVKTGKPFFALYLTDEAIQKKAKGELGLAAVEQHDTKKLNDFRVLVKSKLCSEIEDTKDVRIQVPKSIRHLTTSNDLVGWIRGSNVPDVNTLVKEIAGLRTENETLKNDQGNSSTSVLTAQNAAGGTLTLDERMRLRFTHQVEDDISYVTKTEGLNVTYQQIFSLIGAKLLDEPSDFAVQVYLNKALGEDTGFERVAVFEADYQAVKLKLVKLGAIEIKRVGKGMCWILTNVGKSHLLNDA